MYNIVLVIHVILAAILVALVLLQQGKGADMGAIMGSGGANSIFGVSGASNLLVRLTTGVAVAFMITSLLLVRFSALGSAVGATSVDPLRGSAMEGVEAPDAAAPASTGAPAVAETNKASDTSSGASQTVTPTAAIPAPVAPAPVESK